MQDRFRNGESLPETQKMHFSQRIQLILQASQKTWKRNLCNSLLDLTQVYQGEKGSKSFFILRAENRVQR